MTETVQKGPLEVPGFNGIPLIQQLPREERFTHGVAEHVQRIAITARELAITAVINTITDLDGWHYHVLNDDEQAVSQWKSEAFRQHGELMSDRTWEWILAELKDKAGEYREQHFIRVLDTGSSVCKTDILVHEAINKTLKYGLQDLCKSPGPRQIIIDPQLCPLVYGVTKVFHHGALHLPKSTSAMDKILLSDDCTVQTEERPAADFVWDEAVVLDELIRERAAKRRTGLANFIHLHDMETDHYLWSFRYQCLPCDVAFTGHGTEVRISSYVNNLHPRETGVYEALEKLIASSVKLWNECLIHGRAADDSPQTGRYPLRMLTFGVQWMEGLPTWARSFMTTHKDSLSRYLDLKCRGRRLEASRLLNYSVDEAWDLAENAHLEGVPPVTEPDEQSWRLAEKYLGCTLDKAMLMESELEILLKEEANRRRYWVHPEPGEAFSYDDWKTGQNVHHAVVRMISQKLRYPPVSYSLVEPIYSRYEVHLEDDFRLQGLQVIVKAECITLQPGEDYTSPWQLEGHLNEHIVGVACHMYDVTNSDVNITFEQETALNSKIYRFRGETQYRCTQDDPAAYHYDSLASQQDLEALAALFGFDSAETLASFETEENENMPVQRTGTIKMPHGRLTAFPNVLEWRMQASLIDNSSSGHAHYVMFYLVDPNYKICSTANVPPQQEAWWAHRIGELLLMRGLPQELVDRVLEYYDHPMSIEQARHHKAEMQREAELLEMARHASRRSFSFDTHSI